MTEQFSSFNNWYEEINNNSILIYIFSFIVHKRLCTFNNLKKVFVLKQWFYHDVTVEIDIKITLFIKITTTVLHNLPENQILPKRAIHKSVNAFCHCGLNQALTWNPINFLLRTKNVHKSFNSACYNVIYVLL